MPIRATYLNARTIGSSAREVTEREHLEQTAPRIVVIMVHGTFARNAEWVKPDSPFGLALRQALAPALVVASGWSGGNSVRARTEGVARLRSKIDEMRRQYPGARLAVVAHSHGGNIALVAMDDDTLTKGILGVATLGTPFLSASMRDHESLFGPMDGPMAAIFAGIAVFAVGAALGHGRTWWLPGLLTIAAVGLMLWAARLVAERMRRHARRICDAMPPTKLKSDQLAIVRTSADEAAAALSGARVAGGFASIFWSMVTSDLVEWLRALLRKIDYFSMREFENAVMKGDGPRRPKTDADIAAQSARNSALSILPTLVLAMLDDSNVVTRWLGAIFAVGYGLPALVALLISVASIPFGVVFALGLLPCGWTLPLAGPYLDLTAEPAPPGTWSVTQLHGEPGGELSHGRSHDDPEAIDVVCRWLKERLAAAEAGASARADSQLT